LCCAEGSAERTRALGHSMAQTEQHPTAASADGMRDYQYPYCAYQYPYCDYQYPYCAYQYPYQYPRPV
jgi:hypothetical protein